MDEKKIVKCKACGFETHLVKINGTWRYDEAKHGNGSAADGKCFNCFKPIEYLSAEEKKVIEEAEKKAADDKAAADKKSEGKKDKK